MSETIIEQQETEAPAGPIEIRAAELVGVSYPDRTIELIVMPYEREARVPYRGRMITEIISAGAFDGVQRRAARVRVNRDHDVRRTVGRTLRLHPGREEGLVADLRISRTALGDDTLELAADGALDASAGFAIMDKPDAEVWETRDRRRLNNLWLHHVALTPDPAYEDANVLSVRHAEPVPQTVATPNLDNDRMRQLQELYADIDRRYSLR